MRICVKYGWSVGVTMKHYQCQRVIPKCTRKMMILDTTEFRHHHLTQASVTPAYRVLHGMQHQTSALQGTLSSRLDGKMAAIQELKDALNNWGGNMTLTNEEPEQRQALPITKDKWDKRRSPRVHPTDPRVHLPYQRLHIPIQEVWP